ncbi:stomatal closure-related actin-binding protein 1 [Iris pallida]|uniref:Stomatal closure-related actin-binding protein 1 n=1 Tax=Iris pallida TaxID=29817 RepID=A0AAX6HM56_IRIPA|nr:stomatal closure-related actin-binding protein 1 [Iris pallida]
MSETPHTVLALDVYNDKIHHLLDDAGTAGSMGGGWAGLPRATARGQKKISFTRPMRPCPNRRDQLAALLTSHSQMQ